jgi:hypothetical protein
MGTLHAELLSLQQAVEAYRAVRAPGSHMFLDNRLTDGGEAASLACRAG